MILTKDTVLRGFLFAVAITIIIATFLAVQHPSESLAQSGLPRENLNWAIIKKMTVNGESDFAGNLIDLDADNDTSITADTDDQVDFEVGGTDRFRLSNMGPVLVEASVTVITAGTTITPTAPYMPVTSTAEFTASATTAIADGTLTGQTVCVVNENVSDVIHIPDGANTNLSGQADLGNDDVLCVLWDGADWLEISQVDN